MENDEDEENKGGIGKESRKTAEVYTRRCYGVNFIIMSLMVRWRGAKA